MRKTLATIFLFLIMTPAFAKIPNVIEHTEGDLQYTFVYWPVALIGAGAITAGVLTTKDHRVQSHFTDRHFGQADTVAKQVGAFYVLDPAAFLLFGAGEYFHNEKISVTGETLFESLLFTDAMTGILKLGFGRTRPNGGNYSFPSGHAASAFAIATALETLDGPVAGVPAYLAATFISISRIDMNEHFLSDVVFGAAMGSAIGWGTAHFHKLKNPNLFIAPSLAQSKGLNVIWRF